MQTQERKARRGGFTLVELIVVLVILAILAAVLVPALTGYIDSAKEKQVNLELRTVVQAFDAAYAETYAVYPQVAEEETVILFSRSMDESNEPWDSYCRDRMQELLEPDGLWAMVDNYFYQNGRLAIGYTKDGTTYLYNRAPDGTVTITQTSK